MKREADLNRPAEWPADLLALAAKMASQPGVQVQVPPSIVENIDRPLQKALANALLEVRDRERAVPVDSLKLRIR